MNTSPLNRADFLGLDTSTWLYDGAESPPHKGVIAAVNEYLTARAGGPNGRDLNAQVEASCRAQLAGLVGGQVDDIALLSNASEAISSVVLSLNLKAGDNIVVNTLEYPSAVLASLAQKAGGVEVRVVPHVSYDVTPEAMLDRVDENTRLVIVSHVSYLSGARIDYAEIYQALLKTNALLLVDATQSLGVVPVTLKDADFVVASTYKWLLGFHGGGILAVNPARTANAVPRNIGWRSVPNLFSEDRFNTFEFSSNARRFELGYPSYPLVYALNFSVGLLRDTGIERIEEHVLDLGDELLAGLDEMKLPLYTPRERKKHAGNIAFACARGEELFELLKQENIFIWAGDGRARGSIHGFNNSDDIQVFLKALHKHRDLL